MTQISNFFRRRNKNFNDTMTTIENAISDSPLVVGVKHSLRSAARNADVRSEEDVIMEEEEKMMLDEEITSEEDDNEANDAFLTVSFVGRPGAVANSMSCLNPAEDPSKHRYGLRRSRKQSGSDLERLEMFQSSNAGGLARFPKTKMLGDSDKATNESASGEMLPPTTKPGRGKSVGSLSDFSNKPLNDHELSLVPNPLSVAFSSDVEKPDKLPSAFVSQTSETTAPADKRKVTISAMPPVSRKRGYSIDSLGGLSAAFSDDNSTHAAAVGGAVGRDRAFSFECFAFGINADEPLPPLVAASAHIGSSGDSHHSRPRGDSIIFDPVSFQDGGIHEQAALYSIDDPPSLVVSRPAVSVKPSTSTSTTTKAPAAPRTSRPPPVVQTSAPLPTPIQQVTSTSDGSNAVPFSMELLNRDGRIGIYLPDARRARIARFLAKRQRRVWRKRIKYDCRKKLADSRPRIKGRFVKRLDNEEE